MVVRSKAFAEVGGLDGGLIGGDDLDLSILLRKAGYRLLVNRQCYVHHIGSQTGPRVTPTAYWNSIDHIDRSNNSLIQKHGVRTWYECVSSQIRRFEPVTVNGDEEGDLIRDRIRLQEEVSSRVPSPFGKFKGLDIGCGGNKTIADAIGVDRDEAGTLGQAGGRKDTPCVADVVADILALPFDSGTQDYIVARHVLEHMVDPIKALREWNRVLKPGGLAAIACPNEEVVYGMVLDWTHKHAFTAKSLRSMAELTGFEVESEHDLTPGMSFVSFLRKAA
jgi:SAM-dependent methyltransferase